MPDQAREAVERATAGIEDLLRQRYAVRRTYGGEALTRRDSEDFARCALEASGLLSPDKPPDFRFVSTDELRAELASRPDADDPVSCGKPCDPDIGAARCALPRFHGGPCSSDKPEGQRAVLLDLTEGELKVIAVEFSVVPRSHVYGRAQSALALDTLWRSVSEKLASALARLRPSSPDSEGERRNLERFSAEDWERLRRRQNDPETQERSITAWRDEADPEGGDRG